MSVVQSAPISPGEKQSALEAVLASGIFARSAQLRNFFRYVCEKEIAGQADEIREYTVGIEALGRPEGYSLAEDSAVRSRAHELRQRLDKFNAENPTTAVYITIPKGTYVPVFVRRKHSGMDEEDTPARLPPMSVPAVGAGGEQRRWKYLALGAIVVACICAGIAAREALDSLKHQDPVSSVLVDAWGPLARPAADVLVCVGTKMHLLVRPNLPRNSPDPRYPAFPDLYPLFKRHRPLAPGTDLFMEPADRSLAFGEALAAARISRTLSRFGVGYQILPEVIAPLGALTNRNSVVVGIPMDSNVVTKLLSSTVYTIEYSPAVDELAVIDRRAPSRAAPYAAHLATPEKVNVLYGLITVMPSEGVIGAPKRTVVFSGLGSVGTDCAAEFFSSPEGIKELQNSFRKHGMNSFSTSYQAVVRCLSSDGIVLSYECVDSIDLAPSIPPQLH